MTGIIDGFDAPPIRLGPGEGRAESALFTLEINEHPFYILKQRGSFQDMAHDHGRLLADEMNAGAFPEIMATVARSTDFASPLVRKIAKALFQGYTQRVADSVSDEFRGAIQELAAGYLAAAGPSRFSPKDVQTAILAIEVGNLTSGLLRLVEIPWARIPALIKAAAICIPHLDDAEDKDKVAQAETDPSVQDAMTAALRQMSASNNRFAVGCTGFSIPSRYVASGHHLHARNLDADLYNWNVAPVLFVCDETPSNPAWHKYVAFGTAGLIYPGGISGVNDAGIAVSTHQMSTTRFETGPFSGRADIAPFVQQRLLREAGSLADVAAIVKGSKHFAAWTFFCSDAKTGEAIRVEISGDKVSVGETVGQPQAQTNHFVNEGMNEHRFNDNDAHFTPTFGKWMETRARFSALQEVLEHARTGQFVDVDWAIDQLASSNDWFVGEEAKKRGSGTSAFVGQRAFGHTARKVYGQLGSIVLADPERRTQRDEVWITIGDKQPSSHSTYAGWRVDWQAFDIYPVAGDPLRKTEQYATSWRRNWEESLERYVWARIAVARPRDAGGHLIDRKPTDDESTACLQRAEALLSSAILLAADDGIVEVAYHYMRARVRHAAGNYDGAKADWDLLRDVWALQMGTARPTAEWPVTEPVNEPLLLPYEAALVATLSTVTDDLVHGSASWPGRGDRLAEARQLFESVRVAFFKLDAPVHFDLNTWLKRVDDIEKRGGSAVELPEINFVTVE